MKSELRLAQHSILEGHNAVEIWHDQKFIGTLTGADGPGIRIISPCNIGQPKPIDATNYPFDARLASMMGISIADIILSQK